MSSYTSFAGGGAENEVVVATYFWYAAPLAVDSAFFTADRSYTVVGIIGRCDVQGTGGACTAQIRKAASGTAPASGTLMHTGTFNLVGTVDASQTLTLSTTPSDLTVPSGTSLCFDLTGTSTTARGHVCVVMVAGG